MKLKHSVKLAGLTPQMVLAAVIAQSIYARYGQKVTVTSANDSTHGANSLHSRGGECRAIDLRTNDFFGDKHALRDALKEALGPEFDVVFEGEGTPNEHMHIEWDPK